MRFSHGNSFPFFDNLRDGITLTPQVDTIEGGVKLSTKPFSLYATLFHNRFQGLVTTVITEGAPMASVGGARATGVETGRPVAPARHLRRLFRKLARRALPPFLHR
jgi:outer membrane receptor protein involved in Fe transport